MRHSFIIYLKKVRTFFMLNKLRKYSSFLAIFFLFLIFAPHFFLKLSFNDKVYDSVESLPQTEWGVVFGARVYSNNELSDATKERAETAVQLYKQGKINKIFVSGDNRNNSEAESIAKHINSQGVSENQITVDELGIDTHDTCKHLQDSHINSATLITQEFHLYRAMYMCKDKVGSMVGIKANKLGLLESRGSSTFEIIKIRTVRFVREAVLTWSYLLGIYDWYSNEAELLKAN